MPQDITPINRAQANTSPSLPPVIDVAPIQELLIGIAQELAMMQRLAPHSDACTTLSDVHVRLHNALQEGAAGDRWLTTEEVAERRGVTTSTVTYWCRKGKVTQRRIGGRYLVDAASVEDCP